jgi:hypothetical protein
MPQQRHVKTIRAIFRASHAVHHGLVCSATVLEVAGRLTGYHFGVLVAMRGAHCRWTYGCRSPVADIRYSRVSPM